MARPSVSLSFLDVSPLAFSSLTLSSVILVGGQAAPQVAGGASVDYEPDLVRYIWQPGNSGGGGSVAHSPVGSGRRTMKVVPRPASDVTSKVPPWLRVTMK